MERMSLKQRKSVEMLLSVYCVGTNPRDVASWG